MKTPPCLITLALACLAPASRADNCDAIRDGIASRVRAGGLVNASLVVVDASAVKTGQVVGSCGNGARRIVLLRGDRPAQATANDPRPADRPVVAAAAAAAEPAPAASAAPNDGIPTECKDGSIVIGPDCSHPRAVRMTSREIAKRVQGDTR